MKKEKIIQIIIKHGLSFSEIARELGITPQTLHYQLNIARHFDVELAEKIENIFKKKGITEDSDRECGLITSQLFEHSSLTNHQLSILTKTISDFLKDNKLSNDERQMALIRIRNFRDEINDSLNKLEDLIFGKGGEL